MVSGHTYDKFVGTPLDLALRSQDIRCLVVTGVVTEVCVNCTLLSVANRDYRVTAVTDGVATLWPELQEAWAEFYNLVAGTMKEGAHAGEGRMDREV